MSAINSGGTDSGLDDYTLVYLQRRVAELERELATWRAECARLESIIDKIDEAALEITGPWPVGTCWAEAALELPEKYLKLKHERDEAIDKAIRYDLDAAGIAQRESESRELIELRAEVGRLREALKKAWKGLQLAECQSFYQGGCEECEVCTAQFAVRAALAREEA